MKDDVILNKADMVDRCLSRVKEEYQACADTLETDLTRQDAILLNLQRACDGAIDIGARLVRLHHLGVPQSSRDVFAKLEDAKLIDSDLKKRLQAMVGFRNIAVHDYQELNLDVIRSIIDNRLGDFEKFIKVVLQLPDVEG